MWVNIMFYGTFELRQLYYFIFVEGAGRMSQERLRGKTFRAGLHYNGEGLRSVKNAWPRHGYMRQMVDVPEKN